MGQADQVRALFAGQRFGAPCTVADVRSAEVALGEPLPPVLRELYLAFDGFFGPTNAGFFWPLFGVHGLVRMNKFYREQLYHGAPLFPQDLVSQSLFFGDHGGSAVWGIKNDLLGKVIQWDPACGDCFDIVGSSPLEAWRKEKEL
jgi:SMI1 / KNR4 family (SUKH-1)